MSKVTVSTSTNFSGLPLFGVNIINFTNTAPRVLVTASFASTQFNDAQISNSVTINGSAGRNGMIVDGPDINAAGWLFTNWASADSVTLNGTAGADTMIGSSQGDRISGSAGADLLIGGLGADKIYGGDGEDEIRYVSASEVTAGEVIDGGNDADLLVLEGPADSNYDFTGVSISNVETLMFEGAGTFKFAGAQFGAGGITEIVDNLISHGVTVTGSAIDMSGVTFTNWTQGADTLYLNAKAGVAATITGSAIGEQLYGSGLNDTLVAKGGNDIISGGGGADSMVGGFGDDVFSYSKAADAVAGETIDGGNGQDVISISSGGVIALDQVAISNVERLNFTIFGQDASLSGSQIGAAAGLINTVTFGLGANHLIVKGTAVDMTGVSLQGMAGFDAVDITGDAALASTLTGSSVADNITGGSGDDVITGAVGADRITGGLGKDIMSGGNQGDTYMYTALADSVVGSLRDRIVDFSVGNDAINLQAIDAVTGGGDDAFVFKGQDAFDGAGQIRFSITGAGNTLIEINVDQDLAADMEITLTGNQALTVAEFVL